MQREVHAAFEVTVADAAVVNDVEVLKHERLQDDWRALALFLAWRHNHVVVEGVVDRHKVDFRGVDKDFFYLNVHQCKTRKIEPCAHAAHVEQRVYACWQRSLMLVERTRAHI